MTVAIYEWRAWERYLLPTMFPDASRVPARIGESADDVERRLPGSTTAFCFHVDLTYTSAVPTDRTGLVRRLQARGVRVVNGSLTDISKRKVQACGAAADFPTTIAAQEGDPDERLLVKTDLNYGGHPERELEPLEWGLLGLSRETFHRRTSRNYPIMARRDVPEEVWTRRDLVVERFTANPAGLFFRAHVFLERAVVTAALLQDPVKELRWGIPRQEFYFEGDEPVPGPTQAYDLSSSCDGPAVAANLVQLRQFCRHIGLEFGAIDVAVDERGRWHVIDANATPYWNRPDLEEIVQFLAVGGVAVSERS